MQTLVRVLFVLLMFSCALADAEEDMVDKAAVEKIRLTAESEPLLTVADCVNVLSGDFFYSSTDLVLHAGEPFAFTNVYDSGHYERSSWGFGLGCSIPQKLYYRPAKKNRNVSLEQREGLTIPFTVTKDKKALKGRISGRIYDYGYTNTTESVLRGEPSYAETQIYRPKAGPWKVQLSDGTQRFYHYGGRSLRGTVYLLDHEIKPNGIQKYFQYDSSGRLDTIKIVNRDDTLELGSLKFTYQKNKAFVKASNGETIEYRTKKGEGRYREGNVKTKGIFDICCSFESTTAPKASFHTPLSKAPYKYNALKVNKLVFPEGRSLNVEYDQGGRVAKLHAPQEEGKAPKLLYSFDYQGKKTVVTDSLGNQNVYKFKKNRLSQVVESGIKKASYTWSKKGRLLAKRFGGPTGISLVKKSYYYDRRGNPAKIEETGNITGQSQQQTRETNYTYSDDAFNLLLSERKPSGEEILYTYLPETNLLTSKLRLHEGKCSERHFYTYNKNSQVIEEIEDDGSSEDPGDLRDVTYRIVTCTDYQLNPNLPGFTLPLAKKEYSLDGPLKTTLYTYNEANLPKEKRIFDSEGKLAATWSYAYNSKKKLIQKVDPSGCATHYDYDGNGNKIYEEKVGSGKKVYYFYNLANRLIEEKKVCEDVVLTTRYTYDALGNCLSKTDPYGNTTTYQYDSLGRQVLETDPYGYSITTEYDLLDHPVRITDKEGHSKEVSYTIDGRPITIKYPDGTTESFAYDLSGNLLTKHESNGSVIHYTRDSLGRVLTEKHVSPTGELLSSKRYRYKGKNLIYFEDEGGVATIYDYDGAGRLVAETRDGVRKQYGYDTLGRLHQTIQGNQVKVQCYDSLDRVIEERVEDLHGNHYRKVQYSYDSQNNIIARRTFYAPQAYYEAKTHYNALSLPVETIDPEGNRTQFTYRHNNCFERFVEDPLGRVTHQVYDGLDKLQVETITYQGEKVAQRKYTYSPNGNLLREEHDGLTMDRTYDSMGRLETVIENNRTYRYTYRNGLLETFTQPSGIVISYDYDFQKRPVRKTTSDGTINYIYAYDSAGNLIEAQGENRTLRQYDSQNRVLEETLETGATLQYAYDDLGRVTRFTLPDGTFVDYTYNSIDLVKAQRRGQVHTCDYDLAGNLISEICFNGTDIHYEHDQNQRIVSLVSPYYSQSQTYDPAGNLVSLAIDQKESSFQYDPLNQLSRENEQTFTYDAIYNRIASNGSSYQYKNNLPLTDGRTTYTYDRNGNRLSKGSAKYRYDSLNRLIEADGVRYTYDAFDRLISRQSEDREDYLYFHDIEIGTMDCLRLLARETIAVEKAGEILPTIRDHRGSVTTVLNPRQEVVASYEYSAFGKKSSLGDIHIPWQYFGQRADPETGYVHYLKRVYDPEMGRWLTSDPLGFADGPNPFAFLKNNPWTHIDPDGQFVFAIPLLTFGSGITAASISTVATYTAAAAVTVAACYTGTQLLKEIGKAELAYEIANMGTEMYVSAPRPVEKPSKENANSQQKEEKQAGKEPDNNGKGGPEKGAVAATAASKRKNELDLDALSRSGQVMDRGGLTKAGRALDKHGNRPGSAFPKASGNPSSKNAQGQFHLDDILTHPHCTHCVHQRPKWGKVIDVRIPDDRGVRFTEGGCFKMFLEPR